MQSQLGLAAAAKLLQSCPTLWTHRRQPTSRPPPCPGVPGILQARTLEWVVIFFSNAWKWKVKVKSLSCVQLLTTPWTAAYQAYPPMGFSSPWDSPGKSTGMGCHCLLHNWAIILNKASGGDRISAELFQILKDDAVKVLHSICQQIWKTQKWPQDWKGSVFIPIPKKGNAKECSNYHTIALISHASETAYS